MTTGSRSASNGGQNRTSVSKLRVPSVLSDLHRGSARGSTPSTRSHHRLVLGSRRNSVGLGVDHSSTATASAHIGSTTPATAHHQQVHL